MKTEPDGGIDMRAHEREKSVVARHAPVLVGMALTLSFWGCAGSGLSGGPSGSATRERVTTDSGILVSQSLGTVDLRTFNDALEKIVIGRYRFSLRRREEQYRTLYYETLWVPRAPTDEERTRGIMEAQHRVVAEGRRTSGGQLEGSSDQYRIEIRVENQVRTRTRDEWHPSPSYGPDLEDEMRRMISDIQLEVRTGR